jgi:hypothetical protein
MARPRAAVTLAAIFVPLGDKSDASPVTSEIYSAIDASPVLAERDSYLAGLPLAESEKDSASGPAEDAGQSPTALVSP